MPRKSEFDTRRLNRILQEQHSVISRAQVFACEIRRAIENGRRRSPLPVKGLPPPG